MNNSLIPPINPNIINEETNKTLKQLFKSKINGSFLIKIKSAVIIKLGIQPLDYYNIRFDSERIVTGRDETPEYDICRMIVGIHRHHSIFLSKEEIRNNEKSESYQKQIVKETIEKIKLRQYGNAFFRKKQLIIGDEFLYFPVPYELFVMCMKSIVLLNNSCNWLAVNYGDIVSTALSALTLMENNFLSNAYPLCRGMIELYIKTLILQKHPKAIKAYDEFSNFEIEQSCCSQKYPEKFNEQVVEKNLSSIVQIIRIELPDDLIGKYTHRDYLGAVMKLGVKREKVGDIIVENNGADIIIDKEIAKFLEQNLSELTRFSKSTITVEDIQNLRNVEVKKEEIEIIVASLRLDNVASELARCSRSKIIEIMNTERVFVNFQVETKKTKQIKEGDMITIRGKGRFFIKEIIGQTRSGRTILKVEKFV